jgi:N-methylhydantoinase B
LPLFDRGGDIEQLRASCLAETGLPAPRQPVWAHAAMAAEQAR